MTRFSRTIVCFAVLFAAAAHAQAPASDLAPAVQVALRPVGYQLALTQYAASGNAFGAELVYRVTDPSSKFEWLLGGEVDLVRTLACPGGNGGYCGTEGQLWLTAEHAFHRSGAWSGYSSIQLGGALLNPNGGTYEMAGLRVGIGGDYWVTPMLAIEFAPTYTVGAALGFGSTELYQALGAQLGVRFGL